MQANKLRAAMALARINQSDLAEKLGITENTLCNKLLGRSDFKVSEAIKICEVLNINDAAARNEIFLE